MSVQEGLSSTDAAVIKLARSVARGKVTKSIKALKNALVCENGSFVHDEIDSGRVKELYDKLNSNHEEFQELHERFIQFVVTIENTEALVMEFEDNYSSEVSTEVSVIARLYLKYAKSKKEKSEVEADMKQCKMLENSIRSLKEALQSELDVAKALIISEDGYVKKTAKTVRKDIRSCFESYDSKVNELLEFKLASEDSENKYSTIVNDRSTIVKEVKNLCMELEAIAIQSGSATTLDHAEKSVVKLQKLTCPKFSGIPRDFGHFKRDFELIVNVPGRADIEIGSNLKDAIPEKYKHLVSHLDTSNHVEMMSILEKKFGSKILVIQDIVSQIEKMKAVTSDRMFIEFVEKLQKIKLDLDSLGQTGEIANATCIGKIEKRLPLDISTDWCKVVIKKKLNEHSSLERFQALMKFLDESKERVEYQTTFSNDNIGTVKTSTNCVNGSINLTANTGAKKKKERQWNRCLACDADGATDLRSICHPMETCDVWNSLHQEEKESKVKCLKHPFKIDHTTSECTVTGKACKLCSKDSHHFLLCPNKKVNSNSNVAKIITAAAQTDRSLQYPTLVQAQYISTPHGGKVGALLDLCSTDDYVTHKYARINKLSGEPLKLEVEGIGGKKSYVSTKVYRVPILVEGKRIEILCYGLDTISSVISPPDRESYRKLCEKFGVTPNFVRRPNSIDLLISMRQNNLHPNKSKSIGNMTLYVGPLGKVFGGCDPELDFTPFVNSYPASVCPFVPDTVKSTVLKAHFSARHSRYDEDDIAIDPDKFYDSLKVENVTSEDSNLETYDIRKSSEAVSDKSSSFKYSIDSDAYQKIVRNKIPNWSHQRKTMSRWPLVPSLLMLDRYTYMKLLFFTLSCFFFIVGRTPSTFSEQAIHDNKSVARFNKMSNRTICCRSQLRCEKWRIPSIKKLQTMITNPLNTSYEDIYEDSINDRGEIVIDIKAKSERRAEKISCVVNSIHLTQLYSHMSVCEWRKKESDRKCIMKVKVIITELDVFSVTAIQGFI